MNIKSVCILENRGILFVSGNDAKDLLQNIVTNDLNKVNDNTSCFASLLSPQGKYLFDFIIIKQKKGYFIDCEKNQIDNLYKQLNIYKLRSKVKILNLSNEFVIVAVSKEKFLSLKDAKNTEGHTVKYFEDPIVLDPRMKELGGRLIINLEKLNLSLKNLKLNTVKEKEYYLLSHSLGVPPKDSEKLQNKVFASECNFEELNGIDFKKGCYVGQENTARIKIRNKQLKKILPVKILQGKIKDDDEIYYKDKIIGKLIIKSEFPFGLIKFKEKEFNFNYEYTCGSTKIKFIKPNWIN